MADISILTHIENAKREIMLADDIVKIKDWANRAEAIRQYQKAAGDTELVNKAMELKLRCERRMGELLQEMKERGEISVGNPMVTGASPLADIGVDKRTSSRSQRIAAIPEEKFEAVISEHNRAGKELTRGAIEEALHKPHVAQNSGLNEWYTPPEIIELARELMGSIDCDPASNKYANKTIKAKTFYSIMENGLFQTWHGNVWMNPPYSQPQISLFSKCFCNKYYANEFNQGCVLVNNATETAWFQILCSLSLSICLISKRIKFIDMNGDANGAPLQGQILLYFGKDETKFKNIFQNIGRIFNNVG